MYYHIIKMENDNNCSICYEEYSREKGILKDGNENHDINCKTNCKHWFCNECLRNFYENEIHKCPFCRDCICELVDTYRDEIWFDENTSESEDENTSESENE